MSGLRQVPVSEVQVEIIGFTDYRSRTMITRQHLTGQREEGGGTGKRGGEAERLRCMEIEIERKQKMGSER